MSREKCPHCEFILSRCLCKSITLLKPPLKIIVIQFPKEKKHPLNTVNILKKNLQELIVIEEEKIDSNEVFLKTLDELKNPVLIFKNKHSQPIEQVLKDEIIKVDGIFLIDGSWDKAKRIYFQSKIFQEMKTYSLNRKEMSGYKIRKSPIDGGLSTIESVAYSLEFLTGDSTFQKLLDPFHQMIEDQIEKMGPVIFNEFYEKKSKKREL